MDSNFNSLKHCLKMYRRPVDVNKGGLDGYWNGFTYLKTSAAYRPLDDDGSDLRGRAELFKLAVLNGLFKYSPIRVVYSTSDIAND
jgi:hypothetical protein